MSRVKIKRRHEKPLEQRYLELKEEMSKLKDEDWRLRTIVCELTRDNDDLKGENQRQKNTIIQYRVDTQKMEQDLEAARKSRDDVTKCYDSLLYDVESLSEEWYDRHLDETGNILMKEPHGVEWT